MEPMYTIHIPKLRNKEHECWGILTRYHACHLRHRLKKIPLFCCSADVNGLWIWYGISPVGLS